MPDVVNLSPHVKTKAESAYSDGLKELTQKYHGQLKKGEWFGEKGKALNAEMRDYLLKAAIALRPPLKQLPNTNEKALDDRRLIETVQLRVGLVGDHATGRLDRTALKAIGKKLGIELEPKKQLIAKPIPVRDITKEKLYIPVVEDLGKYLDSKIKKVEGKIRADAEKFARENVQQQPAYTMGEGAAYASEWEIERKTKDEVKRRTAETKVNILNNDPAFMALPLQTRAEVVKKIMAGRSLAGTSITLSWKIQKLEDYAKEMKTNGFSRMQAKQELERVLGLPENKKLFTGLDMDARTIAETAVNKAY